MDAFFASCELTQYPQLKGLPVVVGGSSRYAPFRDANGDWHFYRLRDYQGRGVLTTATYEARVYGARSGMPTSKAAQLAPDAILLPVSFDLYKQYSRMFKQAVASISPVIQDVGIDEVYVDLTNLPDDSETLVQALKQAIEGATGLTCSIGISPNKLLSKIASDLKKPNGFCVLSLDDVPTTIWPLPVSKINGIGPKSCQKLEALGITTVGQLAQADLGLLQDNFGLQYAGWLSQVSHGIDHRPLVTERKAKSISRETTFENDLHPKRHRVELGQAFDALCEKVSGDLNRKGVQGCNIGIKLRFSNFQTVTRAMTLQYATSEAKAIRLAATQCLKRIELKQSIRLLGVRVGALEPAQTSESEQLNLF